MPMLSREQKHHASMQLTSGLSTRKIAALMGMSQSFVVHLRKDVGGEIERQRGGRPKLLASRENRHCVTLITEGRLGIGSVTSKHLQSAIWKLLFDNNVRCALINVGLGAQIQQRRQFF